MRESNKIETPMTPRVKGVEMLIHIVGWGLFFSFPFFFTGKESQVPDNKIECIRSFIIPISFMVVFYVNYCWLVKRYLFSRQRGKFLLINLLLILVTMFSVHLLMDLFPVPVEMEHQSRPPRPPKTWNMTVGFFMVNGGIYLLVAALSVAIKMTDGWYRVEALQRELEKERAEAELQNLKSQLNPHFLFNTLNNIYSLIAFSPERAQDAVHDLSRLLRYVLYESSQTHVPLGKDLDFLKNYIELMRIRLPEHVRLDTRIDCANPDKMIAPLLFISLVENAFKHGVSNNQPSFVSIAITQVDDRLECLITNSFFPKDGTSDKSGSGIGLTNLRKRLSLLYPGSFTFEYGQEGDHYRAYLSIDLNNEK